MGVHALVTGLNGAGKTLYSVSTKLLPVSKSFIDFRGEKIQRRVVVGGIRDLLVEHELMDVPELDPESFIDEWASHKRDPGSGPVDGVPCTILNWWLWCRPGDFIVVDECQRVFRPMAAGRRVPMFISKLETARHYGVEFLYLTQHPQLLHTNVRRLVGPHEDVRRVFGGTRTVVYQWDRVANPDSIAKATSRIWKHDKSAFKLYKSAELHGKFGQRLPLAVWALVGSLVGLCVLAFVLKTRLSERFSPPVPSSVGSSASASSSAIRQNGFSTSSNGAGSSGVPPGQSDARSSASRWPLYASGPLVLNREPLDGRALQIEGGYRIGPVSHAVFGLIVDGQRVASISLAELVRMGYSYTDSGTCSGVLRFRDSERAVTCGKALDAPAAARGGVSDGTGMPTPSRGSSPAFVPPGGGLL